MQLSYDVFSARKIFEPEELVILQGVDMDI